MKNNPAPIRATVTATAVDLAISGLPLNPGVTASDLVEVLDVSNTTNQVTGENTKVTVAGLVTGLPTFVASGSSHAAGLVPDPGVTSHATPYLLGDDGTFHQLTGAGVSYGSGTFTVSGGGGSTSPGGSTGQIQYNNAGAFGGATLTSLIDTAFGSTRGSVLYRGASGWAELSPGTNGQVLTSGGAGADPSYTTVSATPGGSTGNIQYNNAGAFGGATLSSLIDTAFGATQGTILYRGASAWVELAPGTSGQYLQTLGASANPQWANGSGSTSPGGSSGQIQYNNAGSFGGDANLTVGAGGETILGSIAAPTLSGTGQVWNDSTSKSINFTSCGVSGPGPIIAYQALSAGTVVGTSSTSPVSIFAGISTSKGTLTFPANSLQAGKILIPRFFGTYNATNTGTINAEVLLGSTVIGTMATPLNLVTASGNGWYFEVVNGVGGFQVQVGGATGKIAGSTRINFMADGAIVLCSGGTSNGAPTQATVDFTQSLTFDIKITFSNSSSSNGVGILGGWLEVWG